MRILLTGGTGFVGRAVAARLRAGGLGDPVLAVRAAGRGGGAREVVVGDIDGRTDWSAALDGVDAVVHCAARVHVLRETLSDPLAAFRAVNVEGTRRLAEAARAAGVRRFVLLSSVKVHGEESGTQPFRADDRPAPADAYALSKWEAEQALAAHCGTDGPQWTVIRPPLVYGPGVGANFLALLRWLRRGVPLPLGALHNRRSLVALDNLADLVATCVVHPAAAYRTLLVRDGEDLSTTELLCRLARALEVPARLLPVPAGVLTRGAAWLGRGDVARRLCGSLQVDDAATRALLGWTAPVGVDAALRATARHFLAQGTT